MDVRISSRLFVASSKFFILMLLLTACSQPKSTSTFQKSQGCESAEIHGRYVVLWKNGAATIESADDEDSFKQNFIAKNSGLIEKASPDYVLKSQEYKISDSNFSSQALTGSSFWGPYAIQADQVWGQGIRGQGIKVAVIDTGVDYHHNQIQSRLSKNSAEINGRPGVDDDNNGVVDDFYGWDFFYNQPEPQVSSGVFHGTHVAGIILADHSTGSVPGVAPGAELIPVNFMDSNGQGSTSTAILGIQYAVSRGAKIINASWGASGCGAESPVLESTVANLESSGVLFVAASGNEYLNLDSQPSYPAVYTSGAQITVAATRVDDFMAGFSNTSFNYVHVGAPGVDIWSTVPGGSSMMSLDGTSMAAPFVSGAAALLWSAKPNATLKQIRQAILNSVDAKGYRVMTRGRLNVKKALDELRRVVP